MALEEEAECASSFVAQPSHSAYMPFERCSLNDLEDWSGWL